LIRCLAGDASITEKECVDQIDTLKKRAYLALLVSVVPSAMARWVLPVPVLPTKMKLWASSVN